MSAAPTTPGPTTPAEESEAAALPMEDRETYWEAVRCGASHDDAMEAACTGGYTR